VRLLLDTHVLLWWLDDDRRLPGAWRATIGDPRHDVWVSTISIAEIVIKSSLGKLESPPDVIGAVSGSQLDTMPFQVEHAAGLAHLPWHHRDPFDRMLIAQARVEQLTIVTGERHFGRYDVSLLPPD